MLNITSEVSFDGAAQADGDNEASLRLFGGGAKSFCCKYFLCGFRDQAGHFWRWGRRSESPSQVRVRVEVLKHSFVSLGGFGDIRV